MIELKLTPFDYSNLFVARLIKSFLISRMYLHLELAANESRFLCLVCRRRVNEPFILLVRSDMKVGGVRA